MHMLRANLVQVSGDDPASESSPQGEALRGTLDKLEPEASFRALYGIEETALLKR